MRPDAQNRPKRPKSDILINPEHHNRILTIKTRRRCSEHALDPSVPPKRPKSTSRAHPDHQDQVLTIKIHHRCSGCEQDTPKGPKSPKPNIKAHRAHRSRVESGRMRQDIRPDLANLPTATLPHIVRRWTTSEPGIFLLNCLVDRVNMWYMVGIGCKKRQKGIYYA